MIWNCVCRIETTRCSELLVENLEFFPECPIDQYFGGPANYFCIFGDEDHVERQSFDFTENVLRGDRAIVHQNKTVLRRGRKKTIGAKLDRISDITAGGITLGKALCAVLQQRLESTQKYSSWDSIAY